MKCSCALGISNKKFLKFFWCFRLALTNHSGATQTSNFERKGQQSCSTRKSIQADWGAVLKQKLKREHDMQSFVIQESDLFAEIFGILS